VQILLRIVSANLKSVADGVEGGVSVWLRDVGFAFTASISIESRDSDSAYRVLGEGERSCVRVGDMIVADSSINS
jgi:hypothetical protein